jgi:tetratricopeptide (TPR) repeat protein
VSVARIRDDCQHPQGPPPDLVLLQPDAIPDEVMLLQLAAHDRFESGTAYALIGLLRDPNRTDGAMDVRISGTVAEHKNARGLRQFTGISDNGYWSGRGSSGSPVFLERGQQLAGILCKSELGSNEGHTRLQEAFIVPATTIRPFIIKQVAQKAMVAQYLSVATLQPVLEMIGIHDVPIAEIPSRIKQFVEAARAHAAQPIQRTNDGADIGAAIEASRKKLAKLDTLGARDLLQAKINEEEQIRAQRLIPLLKERASIERLAFDYDAALKTLRQLAELSPQDIWTHIALGDLWVTTGDLNRALEAFRNAEAAAHDHGDDRELSRCHNRIGDVLKSQGDHGNALAVYRAAQAIAVTQVNSDQANIEWQRELSICHDNIGDMLRSQGDYARALEAYRASQAIAETLVRQDSDSTERQRDLAVSLNKVGEVLESKHNYNDALDAYRASLEIRERLCRLGASNIQWQRDLSVIHDSIGDVLKSQGEDAGALDAYRASLAIAETLARRDPSNTEWQRDLSISHVNIGDVLEPQGDYTGALDAYRASLAIAETLARRDPTNADWQGDLALSHARIAEMVEAQGDRDGARQAYGTALEFMQRLKNTGRLAPVDQPTLDDLANELQISPGNPLPRRRAKRPRKGPNPRRIS